MASGYNGTWITSTFEKENSYKRIRYSSDKYKAFVEIKMDVTVVDERTAEYTYNQDDITKGDVDPLLSQGEIKLKTWERTLGIYFDFAKTESGYELALYWATFGDDEGHKMYHINDKTTFLVPMGSSIIKNMKGEYSLFPEPHEGQKIYLNIIQANINMLSFNEPKDQSLIKEFEKIFEGNKTINIEVVARNPRSHLGY